MVQDESASPMRRSGNEMKVDEKETEEKDAKVNMKDMMMRRRKNILQLYRMVLAAAFKDLSAEHQG